MVIYMVWGYEYMGIYRESGHFFGFRMWEDGHLQRLVSINSVRYWRPLVPGDIPGVDADAPCVHGKVAACRDCFEDRKKKFMEDLNE
jgi:hypothetical protein